jgi:hypothetical protein
MDTATLKKLLNVIRGTVNDEDMDDTVKIAAVSAWLDTLTVILEAPTRVSS